MDGYVIGLVVGLGAGIGIGISIGIPMGKKQKPWSEMTDSEKRIRIALITVGGVVLVAGVVVFSIRLFS